MSSCAFGATLRCIGVVALLAVAGLAVTGVPSANAEGLGGLALLDGLLSPCTGQPVAQPFAPWFDAAHYTLVANGGFEDGSSDWIASAEAFVSGENESYDVGTTGDRSSLALPSGASAVSSSVCIGTLSTKLRFFVRNAGAATSTLRVDVLYTDALGLHWDLPVGVLTGSPDWLPTPPIPVIANITALPLLTNGATEVAFRLTAQGNGGAWYVDDIYVDPYKGT